MRNVFIVRRVSSTRGAARVIQLYAVLWGRILRSICLMFSGKKLRGDLSQADGYVTIVYD